MSDIALRVENLSKKYYLRHQQGRSYTALRDVLAESARAVSRKFLPGPKATNIKREEFWALKDVSFEVKRGEAVGIIGRNGAGKSTLLKILSRITPPTTGKITGNGRVASLLEVGTGFHPELTGRENIFLNGAILGMSRADIKRKFDEIVDFAEIEKFLDTPVKRYSSGMYVRLAFAVAAHLEPEILVVDEVLAVGDAAFQKKCLGKMSEVSSQEGRTVLFVSHNMAAVQQLCNKAFLINKGQLFAQGEVQPVITEYLKNVQGSPSIVDLSGYKSSYGNGEISIESVELLNAVGGSFAVPWDEPISLKVVYRVNNPLKEVSFDLGCTTIDSTPLFTIRSTDKEKIGLNLAKQGQYTVKVSIEHNLRAGFYNIVLGISSGNYVYYYNPAAVELEILSTGTSTYLERNVGLVNCSSDWKVIDLLKV